MVPGVCKKVDMKIKKQNNKERVFSSKNKISCRHVVCEHLSAEQGMLVERLSNLPDTVVEDVVQTFQARLENCLMDGMEEMLSRITQNSPRFPNKFSSVQQMLVVLG